MPKEYIEKNKVMNDVECIDTRDFTDIDDIFFEVERIIDEQPFVDAVEVVRCGECIHHSKAITPGRVICDKHAIPRNDTDFCSDGRRDKPEN